MKHMAMYSFVFLNQDQSFLSIHFMY